MDFLFFQNTIQEWFSLNKRDFPWRNTRDPYAIWISEIMLQQTQAITVISYYLKFLEIFPTVFDLAKAPLEKVIKQWEGLGYYSRARLLHKGARKIVEEWKGVFPSNEEDLKLIPGIGPYTRNAVLSFAFHQKKVAIDSNVLRVFSRFGMFEDPFLSLSLRKKVEELAFLFLPEKSPWIVTEAFIEIGALVCTKKPLCLECPLKKGCLAFKEGRVLDFPVKKKPPSITKLHRAVFIIKTGDFVLLQKGSKGKVMSDLWEFPYLETSLEDLFNKEELLSKNLQSPFLPFIKNKEWEAFPSTQHSFTRFQATLYPFKIELTELPSPFPDFQWVSLKEIKELPFSSGHKRVLELSFV